MPLFHTHIVVDWSAQRKPSPAKPAKDAIWWAVARDGQVGEPVYVRTRHDAINQLTALIAAERDAKRRVLVGFDFPFGYPSGVARHLTGEATAFALWKWLAERIEDDEHNRNNRFDVAAQINRRYPGVGPCWGNPSKRPVPGLPYRRQERTCAAGHPEEKRITDEAAGAKTVWQVAYNGSVGSQALIGMPAIERLATRAELGGEVAVWPFASGLRVPDMPIVFADVYPSLLRKVVKAKKQPDEINDRAQVRVNAQAFASLDAAGDLGPLFAGSPELEPGQCRQIVEEEGWILGVGFESELRDAAQRGAEMVKDAKRSFIGALRGTVIRYDDPFEPAVPASDWTALK